MVGRAVGHGRAFERLRVFVLVPVVVVGAVVVEAVVPGVGGCRVVAAVAFDTVIAGQTAGGREQVA